MPRKDTSRAPGRGKKNTPIKIKAAERRVQAVEMRIRGVRVKEIAEKLGITVQAVHKTINASLAATIEETKKGADKLLALELERIECMIQKLWPDAIGETTKDKKPHLYSVDRVIKLLERRTKLLGLELNVPSLMSDSDEKRRIVLTAINMDDPTEQVSGEIDPGLAYIGTRDDGANSDPH